MRSKLFSRKRVDRDIMQSVQSASRREYQRPDNGAIVIVIVSIVIVSIVIGITVDAGKDSHLFQANENRVPHPLESREDIGVFQNDETTKGMSRVEGMSIGEELLDVVFSIDVNGEGTLLQPPPPRQNQQIFQANSLAMRVDVVDVGAELDDFYEGAVVDEGGEAVWHTKIRP